MDLFIEAAPCYLNIFGEDIAEICREYIQERLKASYEGPKFCISYWPTLYGKKNDPL